MIECPKCKTPIAIVHSEPPRLPQPGPARPPRWKPAGVREQDRATAHTMREHLRKITAQPPSPIDEAELRFRRRAYLTHFEPFKAYEAEEVHPGSIRQEIQDVLTFAEVDRILYEATRTQYEDERRVELAKSNAEVTRQQIALGERLAEALEELRRLTAYQAGRPQRGEPNTTREEDATMSDAQASRSQS